MMDEPLVSIIICTYKRADLLPKAVESSLAQTYANKEIIVWSDGYDEPTYWYLATMRPTIRWRGTEANVGQHRTKVAALEAANGKYVIYMDDDNFFTDERFIARAVAVMERTGVGVAMGGHYITDRRIAPYGEPKVGFGIYRGAWYLAQYNRIDHFGFCLFRKDMIGEMPSDILSWDMAVVVPIAVEFGIWFYPHAIAVWYQHPRQLSRGSMIDLWKNRAWMGYVYRRAKALGIRWRVPWRVETELRYAIGLLKILWRKIAR